MDALDTQLDSLTAACAPTLVALDGAGTRTASALLLAAGDNPHRLESSASFAALCGRHLWGRASGNWARLACEA
jgi:hypothetical protein